MTPYIKCTTRGYQVALVIKEIRLLTRDDAPRQTKEWHSHIFQAKAVKIYDVPQEKPLSTANHKLAPSLAVVANSKRGLSKFHLRVLWLVSIKVYSDLLSDVMFWKETEMRTAKGEGLFSL
jgi:hypothetical protein